MLKKVAHGSQPAQRDSGAISDYCLGLVVVVVVGGGGGLDRSIKPDEMCPKPRWERHCPCAGSTSGRHLRCRPDVESAHVRRLLMSNIPIDPGRLNFCGVMAATRPHPPRPILRQSSWRLALAHAEIHEHRGLSAARGSTGNNQQPRVGPKHREHSATLTH